MELTYKPNRTADAQFKEGKLIINKNNKRHPHQADQWRRGGSSSHCYICSGGIAETHSYHYRGSFCFVFADMTTVLTECVYV